jgi:hypothetical protein
MLQGYKYLRPLESDRVAPWLSSREAPATSRRAV